MASFEEFFHEHFHSVYHFVYFMVGNKSDAEDLTQEIFIKIANHFHIANEIEAKHAWVFTIARRTVIDYIRKKKTKKYLMFWKNHLPDDTDFVDAAQAPPETHLMRRETYAELYQLLNELPEKMRIVLYLRYIRGMSVPEVANILQISQNNVSVLQNRAIAKLRSKLDANPIITEAMK